MKAIIPALAAGAVALAAAAPAQASPTVVLTPDKPDATWTGPVATGLNTSWLVDSTAKTGTCENANELSRCDVTKVFVDGDTYAATTSLTFRMEGFRQVDDFDLRVYDLGSKGTARNYLGSPVSDNSQTSPLGGDDPRNTWIGDFETKEVTGLKADRWYSVEIVYFSVVNGAYTGKVSATGLQKAEAVPAAKRLAAKKVRVKRARR